MSINNELVSDKSLAEISALLRYKVIQMCHESKSAHLGSSLSCVDILSSLYFQVLNIRPDEPDWPERDIFILSKEILGNVQNIFTKARLRLDKVLKDRFLLHLMATVKRNSCLGKV